MLFSLYLPAEKATKKRNLCDVYLRISHGGKRTILKTLVKVSPSQWDESKQKVTNNHPDAYVLNKELNDLLLYASETLKQVKAKGKEVSLIQFKNILLEKETISFDFFSFAEELQKRYLSRREGGTYNKNASIIKKIKEYAKTENLPFQNIDIAFCQGYTALCKSKWNNKNSTIMNSIKFIRTVINQAILEGHTDINRTKGFRISVEKAERIFLTEEEVSAFEAVKTNSDQDQQIKDMFLLASRYIGLRFSDLLYLKVKNIKEGQVSLRMKKSKKMLTVPLAEDAELILQKYCQGKNQEESVFSFKHSRILSEERLDPLVQQRLYKSTLANYNNVVKKLAERAGLTKHVTSHLGRHNFACLWVGKGNSIYTLRDMLGHSSVRETEGYAKLVGQTLREEINKIYPKTV